MDFSSEIQPLELRGQDLNLRPSGYEQPEGGSQVVTTVHKPSQSLQGVGSGSSDSVQPFAMVIESFGAGLESGSTSETPAKRSLSPGPTAPSSLMNVSQVARHLGVSAATVYALCDRNELAHVRVANAIRVAPADLEAFVRGASDARTKRRRKKPAAATEPTVA